MFASLIFPYMLMLLVDRTTGDITMLTEADFGQQK